MGKPGAAKKRLSFLKPSDAHRRVLLRFGRQFSLAVLVIVAGIAAIVAGQLCGYWLTEQLLEQQLAGLPDGKEIITEYTIIKIIPFVLIAGAAYLFRASKDELGLGAVKDWTYFLLLPLIYIGTIVIAGVISFVISLLIPEYNAAQAQQLGLSPVGQDDLIAAALLLIVIVPLAEEFVFRGYGFGLLRRYMPFWLATVIISAIFGIAHGQWNVGIAVFVLSLALCYMREKTGSIWTGVGLHAMKNGIAFLLLFVYNIV